MGWLDDLLGQTIALDTAPLIYYIEENPEYVSRVDPFFAAVGRGDIRLIASTLTLLEVLVHPLREGDEALAHQYNDILVTSPYITTIPVTAVTSQVAAEIRATHGLKTPDAIHLATAINHGADALLTNDRGFPDGLGVRILRLSDCGD